ncbi:F-box/WD repeat-containing protein 7 [Drosophila obscura]|uniref:F-box/WD repeat-containing protein 7 n=1 Tax=Drosophila obscura TaxID=7282 RepID=UPI001BB15573|nr:F-box/WD repeat-containing protein 7 [Drosophila obscura]XP_022212694.2 F-box/WD repeat-containing protein 7 [Drosophila obscura]
MEQGCPPAASRNSLTSAEEEGTPTSITSSASGQHIELKSQAAAAAATATTSQEAGAKAARAAVSAFLSMSTLREDVEDVCVSSNSQHGFAVVLDDESSTSGVLETFEISSSNSLPTSTRPASTVGVVVAVDDSSSTDTINDDDHPSSEHSRGGFFNDSEEPPIVCLINDDDDEEEDEEEEDEDELIEDDYEDVEVIVAGIDCPNTSQMALPDGTIMTADGSKIFLETPVVEDALPHSHPGHPDGNDVPSEFGDQVVGKPKRLSDEFMLSEDQVEDQHHARGTKSEPANSDNSRQEPDDTATSTSLHDRLMSVRLKQMSLTANATSNPSPAASATSATSVASASSGGAQEEASTSSCSSSSNCNPQPLSKADIQSMDLIERRDFETEQRLTGGIILRTSSLLSRNKLNLSLIKSMGGGGTAAGPGAGGGGSGGVTSSNSSSDDWPSGSNGRTVSSDSKCTYKDLSTTPTSSRKYTNSRLSKSTAKLNLGSTLGTSSTVGAAAAASSSCSQNSRSTMSQSQSSEAAGTSCTGAARTDVFTNTNSNDAPSTSTSTSTLSCQEQEEKPSASSSSQSISFSSVGSQTSQDGGRTYALHSTSSSGSACSGSAVADDAQASTSTSASASSTATSTSNGTTRCEYVATAKAARQVNASAQTQERLFARLPGCGGVAGVSKAAGGAAAHALVTRQRRNGSNDVIVLEVVVEEGAAAGANNNNSNNNVVDGGLIEPGDGDESWFNCDEENNSDLEEICTCQNGNSGYSSGSNGSLSEPYDMEPVEYDEPISLSTSSSVICDGGSSSALTNTGTLISQQRKRKYNEVRILEGCEYSMAISASGGMGGAGFGVGDNSRKRIAYDFASTPRSSSQHMGPTAVLSITPSLVVSASATTPIGRRTPRGVSARDNPPPELQHWLQQFQRWSHVERLLAVDRLIDHCDPSQVRHMMKVIEPQFQRDFISLLPREIALLVLSYLEPKDLLRAAQTCRSWRFLCDDNLLWKEKCRKGQIQTESRSDRPKRGRDGNMPPISSPWKAAYMRQHIIEMNWRSRPVRKPKVLKGHDDHVITCLQFSGNRIVSGSDDNTLKVWSAVNGKCLRTLVGHTGGVWSSQMSGNIIISGSTDRTLKVWDMDSGACVHTLQGHTSTVRCMHLHGNKVVSGSRDATLRVWDIELGSCLHVLVGHLAAVRCVQYDGKLIVSGAYDYMVKIWHPERQECLHTLQGHTNRVYSLQFDGVHVVSGSLDTSIRVWDAETGNCKHTLMGHQSLTSGMELRQNILVSGNADSTVKVWDITTGQCLQTLSGPNKHQSAVTCLQFNSRFVVTSSDDGTVKLWDVKTGDFIRNLVALDSGGSGGVVWRIRANDTKLICAVGSRNGTEETKLMVLDFDVEGACVKCS